MANGKFNIEQVRRAAVMLAGGPNVKGDPTPVKQCGEMFRNMSNGSFELLTGDDRSRLRHGACAIARSARSDKALRELMTEIGTDMMLYKNIPADKLVRARMFCENVVNHRS